MAYIAHVSVMMLLIFPLKISLDIRVYGGTNTGVSSDHLVSIKLRVVLDGTEVTKICTGSILNQNWIISAAHCFRYKITESVTVEHFENGRFAVLGLITVQQIKVHPKYEETGNVNAAKYDVALLNLKMEKNIKFIKLSEDLPKIGQLAEIAGFGGINTMSEPTEGMVVLQQRKEIICTTGTTWGVHGDSGGSLVSEDRLVGIISRRQCKRSKCTTYYADVHSNFKWIQRVINGYA